MPREKGRKVVASNRKARHDYAILDTFEAGMALTGTEVKSLRRAGPRWSTRSPRSATARSILHAHAHPGVHPGHVDQPRAAPHPQAAAQPPRDQPADRQARESGLTLVPLSMYFNDGWAKVELGLARGKSDYDKRQDLAKRDADREINRALGRRSKGIA